MSQPPKKKQRTETKPASDTKHTSDLNNASDTNESDAKFASDKKITSDASQNTNVRHKRGFLQFDSTSDKITLSDVYQATLMSTAQLHNNGTEALVQFGPIGSGNVARICFADDGRQPDAVSKKPGLTLSISNEEDIQKLEVLQTMITEAVYTHQAMLFPREDPKTLQEIKTQLANDIYQKGKEKKNGGFYDPTTKFNLRQNSDKTGLSEQVTMVDTEGNPVALQDLKHRLVNRFIVDLKVYFTRAAARKRQWGICKYIKMIEVFPEDTRTALTWER